MERKHFSRRRIPHIALLVGVIGIAFLAIVPLQQQLDRLLLTFRDQFIADVEKITAYRVDYARIYPSILRGIVMDDVALFDEDRRVLRVDQIRIGYRFIELMRGGGIGAITEIYIRNAAISLDESIDSDRIENLIARFRDISQEEFDNSIVANLPDSCAIKVENMSFFYTNEDYRYQISGLFINGEVFDRRIAVNINSDILASRRYDGAENEPIVSAKFSLSATSSLSFDDIAGVAAIERLRIPSAEIIDQSFRLRLSQERISIYKTSAQEQIDITVHYHREQKNIALNIAMVEFNPSSTLSLRGPFKRFSSALDSNITGDIALRYHIPSASAEYEATIQGTLFLNDEYDRMGVAVMVNGDNRHLRISEFVATTVLGSAQFHGVVNINPLIPEGRLRFDNFGYRDLGLLTGTIEMSREGAGELSINSDRLLYGNSDPLIINTMRITTNIENQSILGDGILFLGEHSDGRLSFTTSLQNTRSIRSMFGEIFVSLDNIDPIALYTQVTPRSINAPQWLKQGSLSLSGSASAAIANGHIGLYSELIEIVALDNSADRFAFDLKGSIGGEGVVLNVPHFVTSLGDNTWRGSASLKRDEKAITFRAEAGNSSRVYKMTAEYIPDQLISATINDNVSINVALNGGESTNYHILLDDFVVPLGDSEASISLNTSGTFNNRNQWNVDVELLSFRLYNSIDDNVVSFSMPAQRLNPLFNTERASQVAIKDISFEAGDFDLSGGVVISLPSSSLDAEQPVFADIYLFDKTNIEEYQMTAIYLDGDLDIQAEYSNVPIVKLFGGINQGSLNGSVEIENILTEISGKADFILENAIVGDFVLSANGAARLEDNVVSLEHFIIRYFDSYDTTVSSKEVEFDLIAGNLYAVLDIEQNSPVMLSRDQITLARTGQRDNDTPFEIRDGELPVQNMDLSITIEADLKPEDDFIRFPDLLDIVVDGARTQNGRERWDFTARREDGIYNIRGGPGEGFRGFVRDDGSFGISARSPLPYRFVLNGQFREGIVEVDIADIDINVASFPHLFYFHLLRINTGKVRGSLRIVGSSEDVEVFGTLFVSETTGELSSFIPGTIEVTSEGFIVLQGNRIRIYPFQARTSDGGEANINVDIVLRPFKVNIEIATKEETPVRLLATFGRVPIDLSATGVMDIFLDHSVTQLTGRLRAEDGNIVLSAPSSASQLRRSAGSVPITLDFEIDTGSGVEFIFPSLEFPVVQAVLQPEQTLFVKSGDFYTDFRVIGDVGIRSGEFLYFDRSFLIREGNINFEEGNQRIDPLIDIRAEIQEYTDEGPVRLFLIAENDRISNISPRLDSTPSLPAAEIARILGNNIYDNVDGSQQDGLASILLASSDILSRITLLRELEGQVRDILDLDIFTFRTQILQNIVFDRFFNNGGIIGGNNFAAPLSLESYLNNTSLLAGKYLTPDLFFELLLRLDADDIFSSNPLTSEPLSVSAEVILELDSPLFHLRWLVDLLDFEQPFLSGQRFEILWQFDY